MAMSVAIAHHAIEFVVVPSPPDPVPNLPLLRKTVDLLVAHPDLHLQEDWLVRGECGTVGCIAGHALILAGYTPLWPEGEDAADDEGELCSTAMAISPEGHPVPIEYTAQQVLGLTSDEAADMFLEADNMGDVLEVCRDVAARAGETW